MIDRGELVELFRLAPKESFELLLRNFSIRENLENLYRMHVAGFELRFDENFQRVFEEFFKFFFRPLELAIVGVRRLYFLFFFDIELLETQSELFRAYIDFIRSLYSHIKLTWELGFGRLPEPVKEVVRNFVEEYMQRLEKYRTEFLHTETSEYPFLLPKIVFENFEKAIESWEEFSDTFSEYQEMIRETYINAAEKFIKVANTQKFKSYSEFANTFYNEEARAFDELLRSPEYLKVQQRMNSQLADYIYYFRSFLEEMLESNPVNPLATVNQMDVAYKRILDLRRKVRSLERRVHELEEKLGGVSNVSGED